MSYNWTSQVVKGELYDIFVTNFTDNWRGIVGTIWGVETSRASSS